MSRNSKKTKKRPVKCFLCGEQMYYVGESKYEPEINISYEENGEQYYLDYIHKRCAEKVFSLEKIRKGAKDRAKMYLKTWKNFHENQ